jgi:hypothetical protein
MPVEVLAATIGAAATIVSATIAAWATIGKRRAEAELKMTYSAPYVFAMHLEAAINRLPPPIANPRDQEDVIINARAIVRLRDSLREPLRGVEAALNGEIDHLGEVLVGIEPGQQADSNRVRAAAEAIRVLRLVWPSKRDEITLRINQVLATLKNLAGAGTEHCEPPRSQFWFWRFGR